jgi:hypothetical protein
MTKRHSAAAFTIGAALLGLLPACGGSGNAGSHPPDFSACVNTPAIIYAPGMSETSTGGGFTATVTAAATAANAGAPAVDAPAIGFDTWTVAITDATGAPAANLTVTADKPRMPIHGHSASTFPQVMAQDGGVYVVSEINFFMSGYWEMGLELAPAGAAADRVAFPICIPE